jgi:hypothetical protein
LLLNSVWSIVRHPAFWVPIVVALLVDVSVYNYNFAGTVIGSDGWGYYLHLPAIFVYGDPHLAFLNRPDLPPDVLHYRFPDGTFQGLSPHGSGYLDKYAFGPAVLQLPFFLLALAVAHFRHASVNGFEHVFQIGNALTGALYLGLGSFMVFRAARLRFDTLPSALMLGIVLATTNLIDYASADVSFSHVYGYFLLAGLVYLTVRRVEIGTPPPLGEYALFGLIMGLAVMVRPTNMVCALLFLVFIRGAPIKSFAAGTLLALVVSAVAASPQMALWWVTTGHFIYYSYTGEGFNFTHPELLNYLFSVRKGVFFWHPMYLLLMVALLTQIPGRRFEGTIALAIVVLGLYVGASWGDYSFGDSFGSRQSIELLPLLMVWSAGAVAKILATPWRWATGVLAAVLVVVNTIYFIGYMDHGLPRNNADAASVQQFWKQTFGITSKS